MSPASTVADTALIRLKTTLTTPPRMFTTVQMRPPSRPPLVHVCGAELYCTITLTELFGFDSSGRRSGEIFELSAKATLVTNKTSQTAADRAKYLLRFTMNIGIRLILSDSVSLSLGNPTPKNTRLLNGPKTQSGPVISI